MQFNSKQERYHIHPYLRRFGEEQLTRNKDDEFQIRETHSAYFCNQLVLHHQTLKSGQPHKAFQGMEAEFPNIQVAWDWAIGQKNLERIDQGLDILCRYFQWNGHYRKGLRFCQILNQQLMEANSQVASQANQKKTILQWERIQTRVLIWEGDFNRFYDLDLALELLATSSDKLRRLEKLDIDIKNEKALLLISKAEKISRCPNRTAMQQSNIFLQESLSFLEQTENDWLLLVCIMMLGDNYTSMGHHHEAKQWFERGYSIAIKMNNQHYEISNLIGLGRTSRSLGDYESAKGYFQDALSRANAYQMPVEAMIAHQFLSYLSLFLGSLNESISGSQQINALAKEKYSIQNVDSLTNLSVSQWLAGDFHKAKESIEAAVELTQQQTNSRVITSNVCQIELFALTGRYQEAVRKIKLAEKWLATFIMANWSYLSGRLARTKGWIALVENQNSKAQRYLSDSIVSFQFDDESIAWSQPYLALAHDRLGDRDQARKLIIEALSTAIDMQAYIPMVFTLPITLVLLVEIDLEFAKKIYVQIRRDRFMSNAQLFSDLVYQHLPEELTKINVETEEHSDKHRDALWNTARRIILKLDQIL